MTPAGRPSMATAMGVAPLSASRSLADWRRCRLRPGGWAVPTSSPRPSTKPVTPLAGWRLEADDGSQRQPAAFAWALGTGWAGPSLRGPGDAGTHGDPREHVEVAGPQRGPAALQRRPAGAQNERRRQAQLDPVQALPSKPGYEPPRWEPMCKSTVAG